MLNKKESNMKNTNKTMIENFTSKYGNKFKMFMQFLALENKIPLNNLKEFYKTNPDTRAEVNELFLFAYYGGEQESQLESVIATDVEF
jgi:hypothetical protein